jgi:cytoskeletal protein RodZ
MGDFGEKFRKAREKKELSLDDVSNVTKINARMLRAIEEEHFEDLPGGVFNKGFIRAYAKHLGLDAEEAVSDYLASLRQAQIVANEVWEPKVSGVPHPVNGGKPPSPDIKRAVSKPAPSKPSVPVQVEELPELQLPRAEDVRPSRKEFFNPGSGGIPWKIVAAGALVFALAVFLWLRHSNPSRSIASSTERLPAPAAQPVAAPAAQNISPPTSTPSQSSQPPASTASAASTSSTSTTQAVVQPSEKSVAPKEVTPSSPSPETEKSDVTVKNLAKVTSKPAEKPAPSLSVVIRASENSWIAVYSDGQLLTQETLIAPAHTSVRASREITIRVGNAAGVSFVWNGKEIPAQGGESEVKNYVFDSNGLRDSSAAGVP